MKFYFSVGFSPWFCSNLVPYFPLLTAQRHSTSISQGLSYFLDTCYNPFCYVSGCLSLPRCQCKNQGIKIESSNFYFSQMVPLLKNLLQTQHIHITLRNVLTLKCQATVAFGLDWGEMSMTKAICSAVLSMSITHLCMEGVWAAKDARPLQDIYGRKTCQSIGVSSSVWKCHFFLPMIFKSPFTNFL